MGLDTTILFSALEFKFPERLNAENMMELPDSKSIQLQNEVRTVANNACTELLDQFAQESEIRVWPHNFDTGVYCNYDNGLEQYAGYSPGDSEASESPYFYNGFYNNGEKVIPKDYPGLEDGFWETKQWGGAILQLSAFDRPTEFENNAAQFLANSTKTILDQNK